MDRRYFLRALGLGGVAGLSTRIVACGDAAHGLAGLSADGETRRVLVYDLVMEGWSTLGSGYLGDNGVLKAADIVAFKPLTLKYVQDPHGHEFSLGEVELARVLSGQTASVLTTYALQHRHEVRVKPTRRVSGATPIEVTIDANGRPVRDDGRHEV